MPDLFRGAVDIGMTLEGDLMVAPDGDLSLVEGWEWIYREVNKRIRTSNPDWIGHPSLGANMERFHGAQNLPATADRIKQNIKRSLAIDNISFPGEFDVRIVPVDRDAILIMIYLNVGGTRVELEKLIYNFHRGVVKAMESPNVTLRPIPDDVKLLDHEVNQDEGSSNKYIRRIEESRGIM